MTKLTADDRSLIKNMINEGHWGSWRIIKEIPIKNKALSQASISRLIKQIGTDGMTGRKPGSVRPKFARTRHTIRLVNELICSQDNDVHSHKNLREI